mmetsp:Transcript_28447/g.62593  ORF Transcript_28447/g.62593 Transcript_28447/m.62593 type:complete len:543 (+) Transcript_28447:317-1945(+)
MADNELAQLQEELGKVRVQVDTAREDLRRARPEDKEVLQKFYDDFVDEKKRLDGTRATLLAARMSSTALNQQALQVELIGKPLPCALFDVGSTSSTQKLAEFQITQWKLSADERSTIVQEVHSDLGTRTINYHDPTTVWGMVYTSEAESNSLFDKFVCSKLNAIYATNNAELEWHLEPRSETNDNTIPDFQLLREGEAVMVGEGKFPTVLPFPNLVTAYNDAVRVAVCSAVRQECGYMKSRGLRYGFLTTYALTFFIKYVSPNCYAVTKAFPNQVTQPSVPEMIYYLTMKALQEGKVEASAVAAAVVPAAGSPSRTRPSSSRQGDGSNRAKMARTDAGPVQGVQQAGCPATHSCEYDMIPWEALELVEQLGYGACGIVSLGRLFGQPVAVKCADTCNSPHLVRDLQHEATVLSGRLKSLQDVYVPALHGCGFWQDGLVYVLAMSVIRGEHPGAAGKQGAAAHLLAPAEQALKAIHALGVAHGDIRAENILVGEEGKVWFIDFGLSRVDPSAEECEEELQQLCSIFTSGSPGSDKSARERWQA